MTGVADRDAQAVRAARPVSDAGRFEGRAIREDAQRRIRARTIGRRDNVRRRGRRCSEGLKRAVADAMAIRLKTVVASAGWRGLVQSLPDRGNRTGRALIIGA